MNPPRSAVVACALVAVLPACLGGTGARTTVPPNRIVGQNLTVERGDAIRFGFAPSEPFASALVTFSPAAAVITLCPLTSVSAALPALTACRAVVGSGVRETVTVAGLRGLAVVATRAAVTVDVVLEFEGSSRAIAIRVPRINAPTVGAACADVDCSPLFEVSPARDGAFTARATWSGPSATLVLLQGRILARSLTSTGLPYREVARAEGAGAGSISGRLSETGEYALVLRQAAGAGTLTDVRIDTTWP